MYLYIFEDGLIKKSAAFPEEDKQACDDGILEVIDLHEENPKSYYMGQWNDIGLADS